MAISLDGLEPAFRLALEATLKACKNRGVKMVPYFGQRTPFEQGKLWRQSRTTAQINQRVAELNQAGAPFLAHCIASVGPQHGPQVTNAVPGCSWHQWLEAMDCFWELDGEAEWSSTHLGDENGYRIYAEEATKQGLTAGGYWQSLKDWPHIQKRKQASPVSLGLTLAEIDVKMQEMYGDDFSARPLPRKTSSKGKLGDIAALIGKLKPVAGNWVIPPKALGTLPGGELFIDSELQLDTDGWQGPPGGLDVTHQGETSLRYAGGGSINSNEVSFFVLPLPSGWPGQFGIELGDYAVTLYKEHLAYAVFADQGPTTKIGEGSLKLFRLLGQERIKPNGHVWDTGMGPGIKTIIFPGSGKGQRHFPDQQSLISHMETTARSLFIDLGGNPDG